MAFVMSNERVAELRSRLNPAHFTLEGVSVEFVTTDQFVASVLPPGFEPADEPIGIFRIQQMQSGMCGDFNACTTVLRARFREWEGQYCLSMLISGEMPVTVGREFWGEVKKHGFSQLFADGDRVHAFGSRDGRRLLELDFENGVDMGPQTTAANALDILAWLSPTGGLQAPPQVLVHRITSTLDVVREGTAQVNVTGGPFDPLGEIPIVGFGVARHYRGEATYEIEATVELEQDERYLPYIYGRAWDDLTQFPVPMRYRVPVEA